MRKITKLCLAVIFISFIGCTNSTDSTSSIADQNDVSEPGKSEPEQLTFYFTPSLKQNRIKDGVDRLMDYLARETKYEFRAVIPSDNEHMLLDFQQGKVDIALMNTFTFVKVKKEYGAKALLKSVKYGKDYYKGQIITLEKQGIEKIEDLDGKRFAFTNKNSTSGYLYAAKLLVENGIKPKEAIFGEKHDNVVEMVYRGMVDAGATYYSDPGPGGEIRDARIKLIDKYPDVIEKVKILAVTDPIPNDPLVFKGSISRDITNAITKALMAYSILPEGRQTLIELYGTESFLPCTNRDYESLEEAINKSESLKQIISGESL